MKSIAIFMLIGLGLFGIGHCQIMEGECTVDDLLNSPYVALRIIRELCDYSRLLDNPDANANEVELAESFGGKVHSTMESIGVPNVAERRQRLQVQRNLKCPTGECFRCVTEDFKILLERLEKCGMEMNITNAICFISHPKVYDQCAKRIDLGLLSGVTSYVSSTKGLACECDGKSTNMDKIIGHLNTLGCVSGAVIQAAFQKISSFTDARSKLLCQEVFSIAALNSAKRIVIPLKQKGYLGDSNCPAGTVADVPGRQTGSLDRQTGGLDALNVILSSLTGNPGRLNGLGGINSILSSLTGNLNGLGGINSILSSLTGNLNGLGELNGILSVLTGLGELNVGLSGLNGILGGQNGVLGGLNAILSGLTSNLPGVLGRVPGCAIKCLGEVTKGLGGQTGGLGGITGLTKLPVDIISSVTGDVTNKLPGALSSVIGIPGGLTKALGLGGLGVI